MPTFLLISMAHAGVTPAPSDVRLSLALHDDRLAKLLTETGAGPMIHPAGDRFVVSWSDWRDDRSVACTELSECSGEGYAAVVGRDGTVLVGPTRVTHAATPHPVAPVRDWERFCR